MTILLFIVILVALILVHEFGHFITAKRLGVRVEEFGIGFPPKALRLFKKGETEYTLNWLPLGGFVRLFGEDPGEAEEKGIGTHPRSFVAQPKWSQALILVAGVAFNVLAAWVLFIALFATGIPSAVTADTTGTAEDVRLAIVEVLPGSPAADAGLERGDEVLAVSAGGETIRPDEPAAFSEFIAQQKGEELSLVIKRGGEEMELSVSATSGVIEDEPKRSAIGVALSSVGLVSYPLHQAVWEATKFTGTTLEAIVIAISQLIVGAFTLSADLSQIAGPVGIVTIVGDAAATGLASLLMLTAFISLNLAIINLIPFPALDGGRLLFVGIETLKGSPIKPQVAQTANAVGFALLILLMVAVTYNDILRLVG